MNDLRKMIEEAKNNTYRNEELISTIRSKLLDLISMYKAIDKECEPYEKNKSNLSKSEIRELNSLYTKMKPIADQYNELRAILRKEEAKKKLGEEITVKDEKTGVSKADGESKTVRNEEPVRVKKSKKKRWGRSSKVIASILALATAFTLFSGCLNSKNDKTNKNNKPGYTQSDSAKLVESDVNKLINKLKENQKVAWKKINIFQNYFNNIAAPTVEIKEDNGNRLFFTGEESVSLFANLNAMEYSSKELADLLGTDSSYFTSANMNQKFLNACRVLNYYYATATKTSGLDKLFVDNDDAKIFREYEELLLKYNKEQTDESKKELHDYLTNLFFNGSLENAKAEHPSVLGVIGLGTTPVLYTKGVITEEELGKMVKVYESVVCDTLFTRVKEATEVTGKTDNQGILEVLPKLLDKQNIKVKGRDINLDARGLRGFDKGYFDGSFGQYSVTTTKEVSREEAVNTFGEEAVKKAEEEAKEEVEKENASQNDYLSGLDDAINSGLYDDIYDQVVNEGSYDSNITLPTNGNADHDAGVNDAAETIIEHAVADATVEHNIDQVLPQEDYYVDDGALDDGFALLLK